MMPKNVIFSTGHLILTIKDMAIFDIDYNDEDNLLKKCNDFYIKNKLNLRLYKTKNGYRAFITNKKFKLINEEKLLKEYAKELYADSRYFICLRGLSLNAFNTRISPKYLDRNFHELVINDFIKKYEEYHQKDEAVTHYKISIGDNIILPEFKDFIDEHDLLTKAFNKNFILV